MTKEPGAAAGLIDAFRTLRQTKWLIPGTPGRRGTPSGQPVDATGAPMGSMIQGMQPTTILDRIDMIHVSKNLVPRRVLVLGDAGDPNSDIEFADWPSDHRAVLATLWWMPAR